MKRRHQPGTGRPRRSIVHLRLPPDSSFWSISFQSCPFSFRTSSLGLASPKGFDPLGFTVVSFPFPFCCPSAKGNVLGCKFNLGLEELPSSPFFPQESESVPLLRLFSLKLSNAPPSGLDFHPSSSFFLVQLSESPPPPFDSKLPLLSNLLPSDGTKAFFAAQLSESLVSARRSEVPIGVPRPTRVVASRPVVGRTVGSKTAAKPGAVKLLSSSLARAGWERHDLLGILVAAAAAREGKSESGASAALAASSFPCCRSSSSFSSESKAQAPGEEIGRPCYMKQRNTGFDPTLGFD
nr:hypothetical protein Iba_chr05aCG7630 [Ipomoea batatas]